MVRTLDFVGIGAARAGSTWMAKCLQEHRQIFVRMRKELHLFNRNMYFKNNRKINYKGKAILRRQFSGAHNVHVCGEFTPRYMISLVALERIATNFKGAKFIVILRDPVERAFSQYKYFKNNKGKKICGDFEIALTGEFYDNYVVKSNYAVLVKNVFEVFLKDQVKLVLYDDICKDPAAVVASVFRFLGVDASFCPDAVTKFVNYSSPSKAKQDEIGDRNRLLEQTNIAARRSEEDLDVGVRARVYERFFKADVHSLEKLIGLDLGAWRHS